MTLFASQKDKIVHAETSREAALRERPPIVSTRANSLAVVLPALHATRRHLSRPAADQLLGLMAIFCGCASGFFATESVSTPSFRSAWMPLVSAPSGSVKDRENAPYERS